MQHTPAHKYKRSTPTASIAHAYELHNGGGAARMGALRGGGCGEVDVTESSVRTLWEEGEAEEVEEEEEK